MKRLFLIGLILAAALTAFRASARADTPDPTPTPAIYKDSKAATEARVEDLLATLTQPEKISLLAFSSHGDGSKLDLPAVARLGIPPLCTCDAPQGVKISPSTFFPMEVVMASTWDPPLIGQVGAAIGQEARQKGQQVIYGPCANMDRTPQSGRYFENFSEDPFLASRMTLSYVQGMQSQNVAACVKHFICNDQERDRDSINAVADERTFREIYAPPFQSAIQQAHAWAVMSSFNRLNGARMPETPLLQTLLRTEWGWDGVVIPDWGSIHDTAASAKAGADIEMPNPDRYAPAAIADALSKKQITQATIDDLVRPILRTMVRTGLLDASPPVAVSDPKLINTPEHRALALKAAQEGVTLLKNDGAVLPLDRTTVTSIAVIGPNAADTQLGGRWSADVLPFYQIRVLDGIKTAAGAKITVAFAQGCPRTGAGTPADLNAATTLAAKSDVAVVVVGTDNNYEGEALDPPDLNLPGDQNKLVQAVAAANKKTIVVINGGTPYLIDQWLPHVSGLIDAWYAGQETGNAVAGILFGDVNPSGKLPGTFAHRREDYPDWGHYPGVNGVVTYAEGVYIGYRHFDRSNIAPLFPFGYGLSYTTFGYSDLKTPHHYQRDHITTVSVTVQNTGRRAGDEVAQLYVEPVAPKIDRPIRELKGFQRVSLNPGEKKTMSFLIDARSFSYWDVKTHGWQADPGAYRICVGSSSRDIRLVATMQAR